MENQRNYSIDAIKVISTILIVCHHFQGYSGAIYKYVNFSGGNFYFGHIVELFFIISGWCMYHTIKQIEEGMSFKRFFLRRYFRLIPLVAISSIVHAYIMYLNKKSFYLWDIIISAIGFAWGGYGIIAL